MKRRSDPAKRARDNQLASERRLRDYDATLARERARKTGLSREDYETLLAFQDGKCAVCGRTITPGLRAAVDHDHRTGEVRGIICAMRCNYQLLGQFKEDIALYRGAADYLEWPPTRECWTEEPRWWPESPGAAGYDLREDKR